MPSRRRCCFGAALQSIRVVAFALLALACWIVRAVCVCIASDTLAEVELTNIRGVCKGWHVSVALLHLERLATSAAACVERVVLCIALTTQGGQLCCWAVGVESSFAAHAETYTDV